jgi:hypothetical protein
MKTRGSRDAARRAELSRRKRPFLRRAGFERPVLDEPPEGKDGSMSDVAEKSGERQKRVAIMVAALVVVGGLGVAIGRCSKGSGAEGATAASSSSTSPSSSSPSSSPPSSSAAQLASARLAPWQQDGAVQSQFWQTEEDPNWKIGIPLRDMDRDVFAKLKDPALDRTALIDLFPDRPYHVRVIGSVMEHRFGLVLVDFERDGKWDEKWDLMKPGEVSRHVEHDPSAGGKAVDYTLVHGKWQPH